MTTTTGRGYGSRKFLLSLLTLASSAALLVFGHLDGGQFVTIVGTTVAVYIAGNVAQKKVTGA